MSRASHKTRNTADQAILFAALGDPTRLTIIAKLSQSQPKSIAQLSEGSKLTRQAITKHLRVLENAGVVRTERSGRESLFELDGAAFQDAKEYLEFVSRQWDDTLGRLKKFVERK